MSPPWQAATKSSDLAASIRQVVAIRQAWGARARQNALTRGRSAATARTLLSRRDARLAALDTVGATKRWFRRLDHARAPPPLRAEEMGLGGSRWPFRWSGPSRRDAARNEVFALPGQMAARASAPWRGVDEVRRHRVQRGQRGARAERRSQQQRRGGYVFAGSEADAEQMIGPRRRSTKAGPVMRRQIPAILTRPSIDGSPKAAQTGRAGPAIVEWQAPPTTSAPGARKVDDVRAARRQARGPRPPARHAVRLPRSRTPCSSAVARLTMAQRAVCARVIKAGASCSRRYRDDTAWVWRTARRPGCGAGRRDMG